MERAWFERHEGYYIFQVPPDLVQRHWFCMRLIRRLREPARDYRSIPHEGAAHRWVRQASGQCVLPLRNGFTHERFEGLAGVAHSSLGLNDAIAGAGSSG